jgi:hypothetical protein
VISSPQVIQISRAGEVQEATISWRFAADHWVVEIVSRDFGTHEAEADDAFEALCLLRGTLEPEGWRIGVAGARADVWPSGMARDQGGGLSAYRLTGEGGVVNTFEPVDPATVVTLAEQRAEVTRLGG